MDHNDKIGEFTPLTPTPEQEAAWSEEEAPDRFTNAQLADAEQEIAANAGADEHAKDIEARRDYGRREAEGPQPDIAADAAADAAAEEAAEEAGYTDIADPWQAAEAAKTGDKAEEYLFYGRVQKALTQCREHAAKHTAAAAHAKALADMVRGLQRVTYVDPEDGETSTPTAIAGAHGRYELENLIGSLDKLQVTLLGRAGVWTQEGYELDALLPEPAEAPPATDRH